VWVFALFTFTPAVIVAFSVSPIRELDPGLQEAVSTLIWAAPRLQAEVTELRTVSTVEMNMVLVALPTILNNSIPIVPVLTVESF